MLVLTREMGERIVIGAGTPYETIVEIVDIRADKVRLGLTAPTGVTINREEIQKMIDSEGK